MSEESTNSTERKIPRNFVPVPFEYHEIVELEIDDITNLGSGVGRVGDWVVMVPFALGGERVKARIFRNRKNFSEGDLVEIVRPSPQRVAPKCGLFGICGLPISTPCLRSTARMEKKAGRGLDGENRRNKMHSLADETIAHAIRVPLKANSPLRKAAKFGFPDRFRKGWKAHGAR